MEKQLHYDFEKLKLKFQFMTKDEIIQEWLKVSDLHRQLMDCSIEDVFEYCEPIDQAREFLGFYLADLLCSISGYKIGY
uniref:Uncharacterized protein n=1 Tax=uncultured prokaryote TaxID=198431 RepID=A0A0H5QP36_9ZZZZ|nr:hypothetical protein [uncultured prokaryote]